MFELVYFSTAQEGLETKDISSILSTSRAFNNANNITGCLIYHQGEFIQILEGEKVIVRNLYERISRNKWHTNVVLLSEEEKAQRVFTDWSMAYLDPQESSMSALNEKIFVDNLISFAELAEKPTQTMEAFWSMAKHILTP